ncbi:wax ester/triacylglycerol synthase family O-acyltransferase [Nocardia yamanashiensis]|uniref:WS/DGAT/MGAT family O-acyltransferase n=1 Tax=Nocardia yamanashiensis TaxID=209247 RepID=UPI001E3D295D|nr:wax ester/triacylglycerol synthase family O-acyltransferase [Nocardia yamanashiensis]UGT44532.1 wax ester/triacylglycerol synthase family O-acyltransferase [Nocardia yamanashiensis]
MERLTGLDASFLYLETDTQLLHVCALLIVDPAADGVEFDFETFKAELGRRLHLIPAMTSRLHPVPFNLDHPLWERDPDFDLGYHVRRAALPAPGGRRELADITADIAGRPLDRRRPLWEMWVVEGLPHGKVAVVSKYHHAIVDGITGTNMMMHLCDLEPGVSYTPPAEIPAAEPKPDDLRLAGEALLKLPGRLGLVGLVPKTVGILGGLVQRRRGAGSRGMPLPFTAPRTPFNRAITQHRAVSFIQSDLADIKEIKTAFGVKVNDVVLAVCGGVLRAYLENRDELPETSLIASVPVSVHDTTSHEGGANQVSTIFARLYTDIADPVARVLAIAEDNRGAKEEHNLIGADFLQDWAQYAPPNTFQLAARAYSSFKLAEHHPVVHNLVISNVPGPNFPMYFLGVRVASMYPFGPVFHGAGLTVTVISTNGNLDFGFIADRELVPDVDQLADAVPEVITELLKAAREKH